MRSFVLSAFVTGVLAANLLAQNSNASTDLKQIFDNAANEAKDILEQYRIMTLQAQKGKGDPPGHTYVKFNELTEAIGDWSNFNLILYELVLRNGVDSEVALKEIREHYTFDFCKAKLQECNSLEKYSRINGTCNNLLNPMWGASYIPMARLLPPAYTDGYNGQRGGDGVKVPFSLPNARLVSRTIHPDLIKPDVAITNMLPQFGQFVDHDISLVAEGDKRCCSGVEDPNCWPIQIYSNDSFYSKLIKPQRCMDFTRSTAFCFPTESGVREQSNILTSYLDLSQVYGSEDARNFLVRSFEKGKLRTNAGNSKVLPTNAEIEALFDINPMVMGTYLAGDDRVNEMPGLTVLHTLWFREHNRIADEIYALVPLWSDEMIFQETRRLVIAEWQNIVFGEYLPTLLGTGVMNKFDLTIRDWFSNYDENTDATIFHAFADAAYRFGHTFVNGIIQLYKGMTNFDRYFVRDNFFVSNQINRDGGNGYEYILDGLLRQNAQTYDPFVTEDLTNFVLKMPHEDFGSDLIARNIHRGRDHGLPPYMEFRGLCGLGKSNSWSDKPAEVIADSWVKLQSLYKSPGDIDLFTGGLVEVPVTGALTGPTFNCLKAMQFKRLKDGDRFFFTHGNQAGSFSAYQIQHIRRRSFGDIICENSGITQIQRNVFLRATGTNIWVPCKTTERARLDVGLFIH